MTCSRAAILAVILLLPAATPGFGEEAFPEHPLITEYYLLDYNRPSQEGKLERIPELLVLAPAETRDAWKNVLDGLAAGVRGDCAESVALLDKGLAGIEDDSLARGFVLAQKSESMLQCDRDAEAVAILDGVLETYGDRPEGPYRELTALALRYKYHALGKSGDREGSQRAYMTLMEEYRNSPESVVQLQIAYAAITLILNLEQSGDSRQWDAAIMACDELIARLEDRPEPELRRQIAHALFRKTVNLDKRGEYNAELETYASLRERFADSDDSEVLALLGYSYMGESYLWNRSGQPGKALASYDAGLERLGERKERTLRDLSARLRAYKGITLGATGKPAEQVALCGEAADEILAGGDPASLPIALEALIGKANGYGLQGQTDPQLALFASVVERYGDTADPAVQAQVLQAMAAIGDVRGHLGDKAGALEIYREAVERYGESADPAIAGWVERIRAVIAVHGAEDGDKANGQGGIRSE